MSRPEGSELMEKLVSLCKRRGFVFPASEIYHFEPLDELVPVYQQPFTLLQEAVVSGEPEAEEALKQLDAVTLSGTLNYQACDDALCFDPVSVPLSFTLDVETLDRQRADR